MHVIQLVLLIVPLVNSMEDSASVRPSTILTDSVTCVLLVVTQILLMKMDVQVMIRLCLN